MKTAVVYSSRSGNTALIARAVRDALGDSVVYFGAPADNLAADLYFVGSWTDKGMCCAEIADFIRTLDHAAIAYFATAGDGSPDYYRTLFERVKTICPPTSRMVDSFFCQGKMSMQVRERYLALLRDRPEDARVKQSLDNFDAALSHPNQEDLDNAAAWAVRIASAQ